jgi:hypothetical protein
LLDFSFYRDSSILNSHTNSTWSSDTMKPFIVIFIALSVVALAVFVVDFYAEKFPEPFAEEANVQPKKAPVPVWIVSV